MMQPMLKTFMRLSAALLYLFSPSVGMANASSALIDIHAFQVKMQNRHTHILEVESHRSRPHNKHIPRAFSTQYEVDGWLNTESELAGAMPEKARLTQLIGAHGIDKYSDIVLVNMNSDHYSLAATLRIYWLLRYAGLEHVSVLKGGFSAYRNSKSPLVSRVISPVRKHYKANFQEHLLANTQEIENAVKTDSSLLDSRLMSYYEGEKLSSYSQRAGSIPNADNIPWQDFVSSQGQFYNLQQLQQTVAAITSDKDHPIICFSEISHHAILAWFVLSELLQYRNVQLYDDGYLYWQDDLNHLVQNSYEDVGFLP
jgi:thiosulfate/3-mercaptopyruvate sulfurtransferase